MSAVERKRIAVFSGATATIQNTPPLVSSNATRTYHGLPPLATPDGQPARFDHLRPQRLAKEVTVYVEQFSAHPLERDAAELYAPPDGYVGADGVMRPAAVGDGDVPVYEITLRPEDGLYLLPYMARQADGSTWEHDGIRDGAPAHLYRQSFLPDASRLFEEIDRFGLDENGVGNVLSTKADFDFYRVAPSGGYTKGLHADARTDVGAGDIAPERIGRDFFSYKPLHLRNDPPRAHIARIVNTVQAALDSGAYAGGIWLEGSPYLEETLMWLNLLVDTTLPICGCSSQQPHGVLGNDGDENIVNAVDWILSDAWKDADGRNAAGVVAVLNHVVFTARELQKGDARPGGYLAAGGHGGIVGTIGRRPGGPAMTFVPHHRHTYCSSLNLRRMPQSVEGVSVRGGELVSVRVAIKDGRGKLLGGALAQVRFVTAARYVHTDAGEDCDSEVEIMARVRRNLAEDALAGFVAEGTVPNGNLPNVVDAALRRAIFSGMPVVRVGRGSSQGFAPPSSDGLYIGGRNLTAPKARILLMASIMKLGGLPPARDPRTPTAGEIARIRDKVRAYQQLFDSH